MAIKSEVMEKGFEAANKAALDYLQGGKTTGPKARLAISYMSNATRLIASENKERQMQIYCLTQLARDKKELKEYIRISQPDMVPKRALK